MGLDIGFRTETEWAPRPGWNFGAKLSDVAQDGEGDTYLSLDEIHDAHAVWLETGEGIEGDDKERAAAFVTWCESLWKTEGHDSETSMAVVFDS